MKKRPKLSQAHGTQAVKSTERGSRANGANTTGRVVLAAAMLGVPGVMMPRLGVAQATASGRMTQSDSAKLSLNFAKVEVSYRALKIPGTFTVLGVSEGHTIFKGADGSMFYLDPATGDKRALARDYWLKTERTAGEKKAAGSVNGGFTGGMNGARAGFIKIELKEVLVSSIVGIDSKGNPVLRNARNEVFTLDPRTGDKIIIPNAK